MNKYGVGNKYGLNLESLWEMYSENPNKEGEIDLYERKRIRFSKDGERKYFDLIRNDTDEIVCMDGEVCEILYEDDNLLELVEEDTQIRFKMVRKEFEKAVMC